MPHPLLPSSNTGIVIITKFRIFFIHFLEIINDIIEANKSNWKSLPRKAKLIPIYPGIIKLKQKQQPTKSI